MTYDPKKAALDFMQHRKATKDRDPDSYLPRLVNEDGQPYQLQVRAESICFFLLEFLGGGLKDSLPDDLAALPTSSKALKEHARPDGGVFLGLFEVKEVPGSGVVVYGDPVMPHGDVLKLVDQFRLYHAKQAKRAGTGPTPKFIQ